MARRRLNLSLDNATYRRAERIALRMGFRSACSMACALLRLVVSGDDPDTAKGEGDMFEGFDDFGQFAEWERETDKSGNIRGRRQ